VFVVTTCQCSGSRTCLELRRVPPHRKTACQKTDAPTPSFGKYQPLHSPNCNKAISPPPPESRILDTRFFQVIQIAGEKFTFAATGRRQQESIPDGPTCATPTAQTDRRCPNSMMKPAAKNRSIRARAAKNAASSPAPRDCKIRRTHVKYVRQSPYTAPVKVARSIVEIKRSLSTPIYSNRVPPPPSTRE